MGEEEAAKLLAEIKSTVPPWVRIMRVNRDIPSTVISAGVMKTNLRQLVEDELHKSGKKCGCIRCREVGLQSRGMDTVDSSDAKLKTIFYNASKGEEAFISFESKDSLFGFVRLRKPAEPFMKEISTNTALVRELHVYGKAVPLGKKGGEDVQHKGLGKQLMQEAERVAKERFASRKMTVISGLGVREYYRKNFNYKNDGVYVSKKI
jgi:elongator complex protein 3